MSKKNPYPMIRPGGTLSALWVFREFVNNPNRVYPEGLGEVKSVVKKAKKHGSMNNDHTALVKLKVWRLGGVPCNSDSTSVHVAADDLQSAMSCMTCGSDSPWSRVTNSQFVGEETFTTDFLGKCYQACGAYIISSR